jgi:hypothetical protein
MRTVEKDYSEELEIGAGMSRDVRFTRVSSLSDDPDYGADADGRRGTAVTFIEEDEVENIVVEGLSLEYYNEEYRKRVYHAIWDFLKDKEVDE